MHEVACPCNARVFLVKGEDPLSSRLHALLFRPHLALDLCAQRLTPAVAILAQVDAPAFGLGLVRLVLRVVIQHVLEQCATPQLPELCRRQLDICRQPAVPGAP